MKLGPKLITAFIIVSILSLIVGVVGYTQIDSVNGELEDITTNKVPSMDYSMEMGISVWGQRDAAAAYMLGEPEGKTDFEDFKNEFDTFESDLRTVYPDTSEINDVVATHDTFCELAEDPDTGLFARVDEKEHAIEDAEQAMEDFDVAAAEMIDNLNSLEEMQVIRKENAQTNYANAVSGADAAMEMKIAVRQQQVAAKGYLLGKDTYSDFVQNEQLFDDEYDNLMSVLSTQQAVQTDQMHANFCTFFYGGNLPYAVTLTMEDSSTETFTVGQVIVGVKPSYDTMITNEQAALQAMADFDEAAAELQTGNLQGIEEGETGGDDDKGLDGLEEHADLQALGAEYAMELKTILMKQRDSAGAYLLETDTANLAPIKTEFLDYVQEFDQMAESLDIIISDINPASSFKLMDEIDRVLAQHDEFVDWACDDDLAWTTTNEATSSQHIGMFEHHENYLSAHTATETTMADFDLLGVEVENDLQALELLNVSAIVNDYAMELIISIVHQRDSAAAYLLGEINADTEFATYADDFDALHSTLVTAVASENATVQNLVTKVGEDHDNFRCFTESGTLLTDVTVPSGTYLSGSAITGMFAHYDDEVSYRQFSMNAMDEFDTLGQIIEYGSQDYLVVGTMYAGEGDTNARTATVNPNTVGDEQGLDYLESRADMYADLAEISMQLMIHLREQQDIAGEYLLEEDISQLTGVETEFLEVAETFDEYVDDLLTLKAWMPDDIELCGSGTSGDLGFASESAADHDEFLDKAIDVDWGWTTADETDSALDGMFTAHYNDLLGDAQMLDQLEDFDAMAYEIATVLESMEASVQITMQQAEAELNMAFDAADFAMELKTLTVQQMDTAAEYLLEKNASGLPTIENEFNAFVNQFDTVVNNFTALVDDGVAGQNAEEALVDEVATDHENFLDYATNDATIDINQVHDGIFEAHDDELTAIDDADQAMHNLDTQAGNLEQSLDTMELAAAGEMAQAEKNAANTVNTAIIMLFSIAIIAVIVGIFLGVFISRGITKPVSILVDGSADVAKGDLTKDIKIETKDEIGTLAKSFGVMVKNLRELVNDIQRTSSTVSSTSQELASSAEEMNASTQQVSSAIQQISKGSQSQASQVEDTANVMKDMSSTVKDVSTRSKSSAETSNKMSENAKTGREAVTDTVAKMKEIQKVVNDSANTIEGLGKRSEEISQIVDVITNITDQTNLLALNAAIEAARAGEHGRGFAVVAEEVKNLAEDSKEAAERIANMIKEIQDDTGKAVEAMQHGTKEVEEGIEVVNKTDESFQEITKMAVMTNDEVQAISVATDQQMAGTERIAKAIDGIASIAEESASASEESASSTEELTASMEDMTARAQELSEMAVSLQRSAGRFTLSGETYDQPMEYRQPGAPKEPKKIKKVDAAKKPKKAGKPLELSKKVKASLKKRGIDVDVDSEEKMEGDEL
jgi:methyl-accepting chemotaxis protein